MSTTHTVVDGYPVGLHPLVTQLLKGMFNSRSPKPRYSHTWDVTLVTKHLSSLGSNRISSLKQLSLVRCHGIPLACPERASTPTKVDLHHCPVLPEAWSLRSQLLVNGAPLIKF